MLTVCPFCTMKHKKSLLDNDDDEVDDVDDHDDDDEVDDGGYCRLVGGSLHSKLLHEMRVHTGFTHHLLTIITMMMETG